MQRYTKSREAASEAILYDTNASLIDYFCKMMGLIEIVTRDFDLEQHKVTDEAEMLRLLTIRVTELLAGDIDLLMSYLYRLDIPAAQISAALSPMSQLAPNEAIAQLILNRQKSRIETKKSIKVEPIEDGWVF